MIYVLVRFILINWIVINRLLDLLEMM